MKNAIKTFEAINLVFLGFVLGVVVVNVPGIAKYTSQKVSYGASAIELAEDDMGTGASRAF